MGVGSQSTFNPIDGAHTPIVVPGALADGGTIEERAAASSALWSRLLSEASDLYSLPSVALEVLDLTASSTVDVPLLNQTLERDPALVAKVLRIVNSSLYGLSRPVSDLREAVSLLGIKPLKLLVLGFSLPAGLTQGVAADVLGRYWLATLTKAIAARELSEHVWHLDGDEAFTCGLFCDLGMLLLIQRLGQPYVDLVEGVRRRRRDLCAVERQALGFNHRQLTAELLHRWRMPDQLVAAIEANARGTHESLALPGAAAPLAEILHLADLISRLLAEGQAGMLGEILRLGNHRRVDEDRLRSLAVTLQDKVRQLADVLSFELPEGMDYRDVLAQAHEQLVHAANDVARMVIDQHLCDPDSLDDPELFYRLRALRFAAEAEPHRMTPAAAHTPHERLPAPKRGDAKAKTLVAAPAAVESTAEPAPSVPPPDSLNEQLALAVTKCRQSRWALSLLVIEIDRFAQLRASQGAEAACRTAEYVASICRSVDHAGRVCLHPHEARWVLLLPACDRHRAVELGKDVLHAVRGGRLPGEVTVSVGVSTLPLPPRNFAPQRLVESAERCLHAALVSGNTLKSIEIY